MQPFEELIRASAPAETPDREVRERIRELLGREPQKSSTPSNRPTPAARAHPRRRVVIALAVLALILGAPAVAFVTRTIVFEDAPVATEPIQKRFSELFGDPNAPDLGPQIVPLSTRKVTTFQTASASHALWVAPTQDGAFCFEFEALGGGCASREVPKSVVSFPGSRAPWTIRATVRAPDQDSPADLIGGIVIGARATKLTLTYEDGFEQQIPLVRVTPPIDAAFFFLDVPATHQRLGARPLWLAAFNGETLIARTNEPLVRIGNP